MIARPSVASLLIEMQTRGQPMATGTGFVVQRGASSYLVTNRHNLSGRTYPDNRPMHPSAATPDTIIILHNVAGQLGTWVPVHEPLYDASDLPLWLEHPDHGRTVDVVALPLTNLNDVELYPHDPWVTEPAVMAGVASGVSIVGFPFGLTSAGAMAIWTQGAIATEPSMDFSGLPVFLIDSRTRPGQSGSPVIFYSSGGSIPMADGGVSLTPGPVERLLGVYSGRINDQSDLGFVWKAQVVRDIIERGVRNPAV